MAAGDITLEVCQRDQRILLSALAELSVFITAPLPGNTEMPSLPRMMTGSYISESSYGQLVLSHHEIQRLAHSEMRRRSDTSGGVARTAHADRAVSHSDQPGPSLGLCRETGFEGPRMLLHHPDEMKVLRVLSTRAPRCGGHAALANRLTQSYMPI